MLKYLFIVLIIYIYFFSNKTHSIYGPIQRSKKELQKGLMFRKKPLQANEGMLFAMKQNSNNTVWMKNTYIPLDIIFLDSSMKVVGYKMNTTPLSLATISINKPSSYILEMNSGSITNLDISKGDLIDFMQIN